MRIKLLYITLTILSAVTIFVSCKKERLLSTGGELRFSIDTLMFDTVFTDRGNFTASLKIYNPQDQVVKISAVRLQGGGTSFFKLNVNGQAGNVVSNIEVAANDSIYVFATVNIDPTNANNPFIIEDRLIANLNGKDFSIPFIAYGQNAYYVVDSIIAKDDTWKTDKPYVVMHNMAVDEGKTLNIPAGCRVYVHADSRIYVLGTLNVNGTKQDSVVFQGDRLDRKYFGNEGYPGEWGGFYFFGQSKGSVFNYAVIKNCGSSTNFLGRVGEPTAPAAIQLNYDSTQSNEFQLDIRNSIIENSIGYGILSFTGRLRATNCLINTCGASCLATPEGGLYVLEHCTFVTYGTDKVSHVDVPTMALINYFDVSSTQYTVGPLVCSMKNCVVWGPLETEAFVNSRDADQAQYDVTIENCLLKTKDGLPANVNAISNILNQDPLFEDPGGWNYRPREGSPLINNGASTALTTDLDNKARDGQPDIGCYER